MNEIPDTELFNEFPEYKKFVLAFQTMTSAKVTRIDDNPTLEILSSHYTGQIANLVRVDEKCEIFFTDLD